MLISMKPMCLYEKPFKNLPFINNTVLYTEHEIYTLKVLSILITIKFKKIKNIFSQKIQKSVFHLDQKQQKKSMHTQGINKPKQKILNCFFLILLQLPQWNRNGGAICNHVLRERNVKFFQIGKDGAVPLGIK